MPEAAPSSPTQDLETWLRVRETRPPGQLLTPDQIELAQSGVSVTLAARSTAGRPVAGGGVGCRALPDGALRILLSGPGNAPLLEAVQAGSAVAVTFTCAPDHRAFQVKASAARIRPAAPEEVPEMERQCAMFRDGLVEIGFPPAVAEGFVGFRPEGLVALELVPERVFTQTPGPGAGAELVP